MGKNLIIGGAANYTYEQLSPWINSAIATGTDAEIVLCCTNMKNEELEKIAAKGVNLLLYGKRDDKTGEYTTVNGVPHVDRFFHLWNYLDSIGRDEYGSSRLVVVTDTRDVIFQTDPFKNGAFRISDDCLVATTEGLVYKDEPWGYNNIETALGPFFTHRLKDLEICNVGVLGGGDHHVRGALLNIYLHGRGRGIVDQAVYNQLIYENMISDVGILSQDFNFCINLGTTLPAIEAGSGDLGMMCRQDPAMLDSYKKNYLYDQPTITDDGRVLNIDGEEYAIVHQYDRVPALKPKILERYKDG